MALFEVLRDDANLGTDTIDATHKWSLPGVTCPQCGPWGNVGLEYPTVNLASLPNQKEYERARPVSLNEFARLREPIARLMELDALLLPGTHFGPLVGNAKGEFVADFAWVNPWTLLATAESLAWLTDRIPNLKGVTPELTFTRSNRATLLELQLEPKGELLLPYVQNGSHLCSVCGRDSRSRPEQIVIARSSIPANFHLFRVRNFTTLMLATGRFVKAVQDLGLIGLRFEEVRISD